MLRRCFTISTKEKELEINEEIRDKEVRLIGADGAQVGIISVKEALKLAEESELDLVKISPNAVPSVCKVMDYGKYRFDQIKREKEARKKNKAQETKIIILNKIITDVNLTDEDIDKIFRGLNFLVFR